MQNIQYIKVNEDSSIKVEYLKTYYVDIPNPDNLKGDALVAYIGGKISEISAEEDFLDPEDGILDQLEIVHRLPEPVVLTTEEIRTRFNELRGSIEP